MRRERVISTARIRDLCSKCNWTKIMHSTRISNVVCDWVALLRSVWRHNNASLHIVHEWLEIDWILRRLPSLHSSLRYPTLCCPGTTELRRCMGLLQNPVKFKAIAFAWLQSASEFKVPRVRVPCLARYKRPRAKHAAAQNWDQNNFEVSGLVHFKTCKGRALFLLCCRHFIYIKKHSNFKKIFMEF